MEYLFKVLVVGEANVGKSSIIKRYVDNEFDLKYKYTIGVDFALKQLQWKDDTTVRLQLWDIAGQERFGVMTHVYYKQAVAACVVFDITQPKTLQAAIRWKADLDEKVLLPSGATVPALLLANKCDLRHTMTSADLNKFVQDHGFIGWFETSAKAGHNIDKAMSFLVESILSNTPNDQDESYTSASLSSNNAGFTLGSTEFYRRYEREQNGSGCCILRPFRKDTT